MAADTLTPNLNLTNQTEGGNANTWGIKADDNFEQIDDKLGDTTDITTTGGSTTLTDEQELVAALQVGGTLVANATIVFSGRGGVWVIENNTTGAFSLTAKVSGQTGVEIAQGSTTIIWCDGTDIRTTVPTSELVADVTPPARGRSRRQRPQHRLRRRHRHHGRCRQRAGPVPEDGERGQSNRRDQRRHRRLPAHRCHGR
jgi:hypothetical protein